MNQTTDYQAAQAQERQLLRALRELHHLPPDSHIYRVRAPCLNRLITELEQTRNALNAMDRQQRRRVQPVRWHHIDQMSPLERAALQVDGHLAMVALWLRGRQATVAGWAIIAMTITYLLFRLGDGR